VDPASGSARSVEARLAEIAAAGRRTRRPTPRGLWLAAALVAGICTAGLVAMLATGWRRGEPVTQPINPPAARPIAPAAQSGLGIGLVIGAGVGIVIGFAIGRHRDGHSSRNNP
jgi:hypothetical protein